MTATTAIRILVALFLVGVMAGLWLGCRRWAVC